MRSLTHSASIDGGTIHRIEVDNPLHVSRGVASVVFDREPLPDDFVPRRDDGRTHESRVTLGGPYRVPV